MFIDEVISNGDFIAIHWRYDKDDWLAANCKEGVSVIGNRFRAARGGAGSMEVSEASGVSVSKVRNGKYSNNQSDDGLQLLKLDMSP